MDARSLHLVIPWCPLHSLSRISGINNPDVISLSPLNARPLSMIILVLTTTRNSLDVGLSSLCFCQAFAGKCHRFPSWTRAAPKLQKEVSTCFVVSLAGSKYLGVQSVHMRPFNLSKAAWWDAVHCQADVVFSSHLSVSVLSTNLPNVCHDTWELLQLRNAL